MIIATPRIMYFALGMLALLLCGVHWLYGLPLILYIAWAVRQKPQLATPFISGFVLMALYMSPVISVYVHIAYGQWATFIGAVFGQ